MTLSGLKPNKGANRPSKKIGRGNGSGHGRTSCRGSNGANSRAGATHYARFEGGQMPLQRRLPKRGFRNYFSSGYTPINLGDVDAHLESTALVDAEFLAKVGLIKSAAVPVKILGEGEVKKAVTWKNLAFSRIAFQKIEKSGGKIEGGKVPQPEKKVEKPKKIPVPVKEESSGKQEKAKKAPVPAKTDNPNKSDRSEKKKGPAAPAKE
jgi:large subunit ribosomal protein L15